mgnify:FL=1
MKAVITGASSGLGADMARVLIDEGYEVVLVARRKTRLEKLQKELGDKASYIVMDVSSTYNCMELYNSLKKEDVGILINCVGFGLYGDFTDSNMDKELDMIDLNIKSVHTLTKLFLKDFVKKDRGYILNVASMAGFMPGPGMATYYATKSYVLSFTEAIREELRRSGSGVSVSCLCPGPVDTNFNKVAKVEFSSKGMNSMDVAKYAIKNMFNEKLLIIPSFKMKLVHVLVKFLPVKLVMRFVYNFQKSKS